MPFLSFYFNKIQNSNFKNISRLGIEANNVYRPKIYNNIWKTGLGMDLDNSPEIEAALMYGQIPVRLLNEHPQRIIPPICEVTLNQQYSLPSVTRTRRNTSSKFN